VRIFSGIQPTGRKHVGNYIGAIRGWVEGQDRGDPTIHCMVDLHATSVAYDPKAPGPRVLFSQILLQEGRDWDAAERALRDVLSIDPDHAETKHNLNVLLRRLGRETVPVCRQEILAEIDVQRTRDDRLVVIHDETLGRTTDGHGAVADPNRHAERFQTARTLAEWSPRVGSRTQWRLAATVGKWPSSGYRTVAMSGSRAGAQQRTFD
jgi:hypothetical protein